MKLTKEALRGVIKEVLKERTDLRKSAPEEATKSKLAMGMKAKLAEFVQDPEVKPTEIQVLAAVIDTLMENAQRSNLATGTAQTILQAALAKLDREEQQKKEFPPQEPKL